MNISDRRRPNRWPGYVNSGMFISWGVLVALQHDIFHEPYREAFYTWMNTYAPHEFWGWGAFFFGCAMLFSTWQPWWKSRLIHWLFVTQALVFWTLLFVATICTYPVPTDVVLFGANAVLSFIQVPAIFPRVIRWRQKSILS